MMQKIIIISLIIIFLSSLAVFIQLNINSLYYFSMNGHIIEKEEEEFIKDSRKIRKVKLLHSELGYINLAISFPNEHKNNPLPVLFILGGLETGLDSIKHVSDIGDNILVGFEWPVNHKITKGKNILLQFSKLYRDIYNSPSQAAAALEWVSNQEWAEQRISLLGFSIGSIIVPTVQRLLENRNSVKVGWTVLAYGGTNIGLLINSNPYIKPEWTKPFFGWIVQILFNPLDPKEHLPHIRGKFLVINGKEDNLIPYKSSSLMQKLTPSPKKIILLEGNHMGVGNQQKELLKIIIEKTRKWLVENNAINHNI